MTKIQDIILEHMPEDLRPEIRGLQLIGARQAAHAILQQTADGVMWEGMSGEEIRDKLWEKMPLPFLKDISEWANDLYQWIDEWAEEIAKAYTPPLRRER